MIGNVLWPQSSPVGDTTNPFFRNGFVGAWIEVAHEIRNIIYSPWISKEEIINSVRKSARGFSSQIADMNVSEIYEFLWKLRSNGIAYETIDIDGLLDNEKRGKMEEIFNEGADRILNEFMVSFGIFIDEVFRLKEESNSNTIKEEHVVKALEKEEFNNMFKSLVSRASEIWWKDIWEVLWLIPWLELQHLKWKSILDVQRIVVELFAANGVIVPQEFQVISEADLLVMRDFLLEKKVISQDDYFKDKFLRLDIWKEEQSADANVALAITTQLARMSREVSQLWRALKDRKDDRLTSENFVPTQQLMHDLFNWVLEKKSYEWEKLKLAYLRVLYEFAKDIDQVQRMLTNAEISHSVNKILA